MQAYAPKAAATHQQLKKNRLLKISPDALLVSLLFTSRSAMVAARKFRTRIHLI
jgi:hypothetical protein